MKRTGIESGKIAPTDVYRNIGFEYIMTDFNDHAYITISDKILLKICFHLLYTFTSTVLLICISNIIISKN